MWIRSRYRPVLCLCLALVLIGCSRAAWQPRDVNGPALETGRYLDLYYRGPNFDPAAAVYRVEIFPVDQVRGIGQEQAQTLFNEGLVKAMTGNGLKVNQEEPAEARLETAAQAVESTPGRPVSLMRPKKSREQPRPEVILSGVVHQLAVSSPTWRFFSGRGHATLQVRGEIRRGPEVVFAFQDQVTVNPPVNPQHRPPLESDLIARLAIRRFTANFLNELLLLPKTDRETGIPATAPPDR